MIPMTSFVARLMTFKMFMMLTVSIICGQGTLMSAEGSIPGDVVQLSRDTHYKE
jgi:hypothetical protein